VPRSEEDVMSNPFVHVELNSPDLGPAQAFYTQLFDWETRAAPLLDGSYTTINVGRGTGGGMFDQHLPDAAPSWLPYVEVDDIHAATFKARRLGATVVKDVTEVPGIGWFSIIRDPTGAKLGMWKQARPVRNRRQAEN
jgi:predicted enzyme related to lactoylglutathione lyase